MGGNGGDGGDEGREEEVGWEWWWLWWQVVDMWLPKKVVCCTREEVWREKSEMLHNKQAIIKFGR